MIDLFLPRLSQYLLITSGVILWGVFYSLYKNFSLIDRTAMVANRPLRAADPNADRRSSNRIRSRAKLGLKSESWEGVMGTATLHDVSKTGACFESPVLLQQNQKIVTRMHSGNQEGILELSAQVVWIKPGQSSHLYGVHFLSL